MKTRLGPRPVSMYQTIPHQPHETQALRPESQYTSQNPSDRTELSEDEEGF